MCLFYVDKHYFTLNFVDGFTFNGFTIWIGMLLKVYDLIWTSVGEIFHFKSPLKYGVKMSCINPWVYK